MVAIEIHRDRELAKELFKPRESYMRPERRYAPPLLPRMTSAGSPSMKILEERLEREQIELRKSIDADRNELAVAVHARVDEVDRADSSGRRNT